MDTNTSLSQLLLDDAEQILHDVTSPTPAPSIEDSSAQTPATPTETDPNLAIRQKLYHIKDEIDSLLRLIGGPGSSHPPVSVSSVGIVQPNTVPRAYESRDRIVEGTFTGQKMLGTDGQEYHMPPNYASKSKLVEGDHMKLTITDRGAFIYKQTSPVPRKRLVGTLAIDTTTGQWSALIDNRSYKILTASATFYHGVVGDEVIFLVPESGESHWGAVENIVHK